MKKAMKAAVCGLVLVGSLGLGMIAEAGRIPSHMVPLQTYATKKVTCYKSPGGAAQGWIDAGDYVIVNQIRSDGWAYGSYPVKNGRTSRWFRVDDLLKNPSFRTLDRMSPSYKVNVYNNYSYNGTIGSIWGNENIWVVSNLGDVWQIVYKVNNGGYKMGWVPYWDCLEKPVSNPVVKPVTRTQTVNNSKTSVTKSSVTNSGLVSPSGLYYPLGKKTEFVDKTGEGTPHDFIISAGTPVYAPGDGAIYCYQIMGNYKGKFTTVSYGNVIFWLGNINGKRYGAKFAHLQSFKGCSLKYASEQTYGSTTVKKNNVVVVTNRRNENCGSRQVKAGEIIGYVGSVGNSSGAHLHCELYINPSYGNGVMSKGNGTRENVNSYFNK